MKIISVGEILWDIFDTRQSLGGAPLNFAVSAHRLGHQVILVSAVGNDDHGRRALAAIQRLGLSTDFIRRVPKHPTGTVTVSFDATGEPEYTIHRPAAFDFLEFDKRLAQFQPDWISFGTLLQMDPGARDVTRRILNATRPARRLYDLNLRKDSFTPALVEELLGEADAVKVNHHELEALGRRLADLKHPYRCETRGKKGCVVCVREDCSQALGIPVQEADPVGAGDAFAAAFLHGIGAGWPPARIANFANRLGALIASRPGAIPDWTATEI